MSDAYSSGWSLLDVPLSPVYGILDTLANVPGINQTQFGNWLNDSPLFRGARNFRDDQPGWALGTDIAASFIPYIGWGSALNRAGQGANLLGRVNQAGAAAARLAPRNAPVAFALGETVRYSPVAAAITGFDLAGGRYESPMDALAGFGLGSAGGAAFQAAGHALAPTIQRIAPQISQAWSAVFEPGPQLSELYGFSTNVQRAARQTAASPVAQEALSPTLEPQQRAAALWDLIGETNNGQHPDIDVDVLRGQYDTEVRAILGQELDPAERGFRFPTGVRESDESMRVVDQLIRLAPNGNGKRVRVPITASNNSYENPDVLGSFLELPEGWVHSTSLPGITQVELGSAERFRQLAALDTERAPANGWQRLERNVPSGRQIWSIRQEGDDGAYLLTTELPQRGAEIPRMTGRARYASTRDLDKAAPARHFFSFKTHNPSAFFPEMRNNFDSPDAGVLGRLEDRIPTGRSAFLDKALDFKKIFLNPTTLKAAYAAKYGGKQEREQFLRAILAGPTMGKEMAQLVETYAMPTQFQLRDSPEGRGILSLYQALFDAAEGRARASLHGVSSIPEGKNPITSLFGTPQIADAEAVAAKLRKTVQEDPEALELIRQAAFRDDFPIESIAGTPAGQWLNEALAINLSHIEEINAGIEALRKAGATDSRLIPIRQGHIGISRKWDGSVYYPIYAEGALYPTAVRAGNGRQQAEAKAREWVAAAAGDGKKYRVGNPFITGQTDQIPVWMKRTSMNPGLLEPRSGMRGYEHEFEPFKHIDDLIKELEEGYVVRQRYFASVVADALTTGKLNTLKARDPNAYKIVSERIRQLKGQPGPLEARMNQIVDSALAPALGTNSFSKISDGFNEFNFHMLHGVGNIATPALNLTSVLQTQLPAATNFLTADLNVLKSMGFQFPVFGADGLPRPGFNFVTDPMALLWGGFKKAMSEDPEVKEVYNVLFNRKIMGTGLANEYTGQDRTLAARWSEGIRGPEDFGHWLSRGSSYLMSKTEQISRTTAAGMALKAMDMMEAATGVKFTIDQKIANAARMVEQTNFGYFQSDRPMMYTTPLGSIFGNQKTWMTNYLFMMMEYGGLAQKGNYAPLVMTLATTTALGGVFAVPIAGQAFDAITETFAQKDATEFIYEKMGEGGNGVSFGLPGLLGMSISGNVSAPGSNLAHDSEFFFTVVALERAKLMGRAIGRAWDDQVTLGINPLKDQLFGRQMMQAFAPRALYRTWESITSDSLTSAATGYPLVRELGWGARLMNAMGFRDTDIAIQYAAYERLVSDRDAMRRRVSLFGEAYANASLSQDRRLMMELLQQAAVSGVDINSVMRSAQIRMRNAGTDMFGRNFNEQQLERYQSLLAAGGQ